MIKVMPDFYERFRCVGGVCNDNCCRAGWDIEIDKKSLSFYESVGGVFGEKLRGSIKNESFDLSGGVCPLLNEKGLCEIILNCGEDKLCEICTNHPRFFEWFSDRTEMGVGLCCEEACRLLFESDEPLELTVVREDGENGGCNYSKPLYKALLAVRETLFDIAKNRTLTLLTRILICSMLVERVQTQINLRNTDNVFAFAQKYSDKAFQNQLGKKLSALSAGNRAEYTAAFLDTLAQTEPISDEWENFLVRVSSLDTRNVSFAAAQRRFSFAYERIFVYTLFRYFLKSVYDANAASKFSMAVSAVFVTALGLRLSFAQRGSLSYDDLINAAKLYSKQLEYDDEAETIISGSGLFTPKAIRQLI